MKSVCFHFVIFANNYCLLFFLQFICAGVHGVFSWAFCDFGPQFEVLDSTGEEPKECFIWKITKVRHYLLLLYGKASLRQIPVL